MKLQSPVANEFDRFHSHTDKPLRVHMEGVLNGTRLRSAAFSSARVAEVAALFHDLGKLNPNFQPKVNPNFRADGEVTNREYSNHAYLSTYAFLCFCACNNLEATLGLRTRDVWQVLALIAHHHGHLPNFLEILNLKQCEQTVQFVQSQPPLPVCKYLQQWLAHQEFDIFEARYQQLFLGEKFRGLDRKPREKHIIQRLDYFQETQFAFASLIEADKRDAGDNQFLRRADQLQWAQDHFAPQLQTCFETLQASDQATEPLNIVRTQIRHEATAKLRAELANGTRTFSLTAPTGAGKTYTLLSLADAIRAHAPEHAVIYGLPFLTITEQVEDVCRQIFGEDFVSRFDSRTQNAKLDELQEALDAAPQEERSQAARALLATAFSVETFDAAFTITTFVQIFETLLSNRNATLLKLPNFSKTIFLLDEIQALPPRLYVFFAAYLQAFCEKFDSYAIFSTATMPAFAIAAAAKEAHALFHDYQPPLELLSLAHFENTTFDRYEVRPLQPAVLTREELTQKICDQDSSSLIVLNTIEDSKRVYDLLRDSLRKDNNAKVILLNTHFTLRDRQEKIARCKTLLASDQRVILVSTQLIEAGVDIDFPTVFRDLCPLPNLIQTAGRCNRNGKNERGCVWFFELQENKQSRAELIYRNEPAWFLNFSRQQVLITEGFKESELLPLQRQYFDKASADLKLGQHPLKIDGGWQDANLVQQIDELAHKNVGSFRLIDEDKFGESFRYFVPRPEDDADNRFEQLQHLVQQLAQAKQTAGGRLPYDESKAYQLRIEAQLHRMSLDIVQFRVPRAAQPPSFVAECCGIRCLSLPADYNSQTGISFSGVETAIL